jgi:hypothetical protein
MNDKEAAKELRECPFCGGEPRCFVWSDGGLFYVKCDRCKIHTLDYKDAASAKTAWNTRHEAAKTAPGDECECGHKRDEHFSENDGISPTSVNACDCCDHGMFCRSIAAVSAGDEWVSVEDRLPDAMGWYLISTALGHVSDGFYRPDKGFRRGEGEVVAWRPLPQPYKRIDSPKETK